MLLHPLLAVFCLVASGATLEEEYLALSEQARDADRFRRLNASLVRAAEHCDEKKAQTLIELGAVPAMASSGGVFAAEAAASCETPETLHLLLAHGAAVNSPAYRETLLRRALRAERDRTAELLISMRTDPTDGLEAALERGDELLAIYFLQSGADTAAIEERHPLGQAIRGDSPDPVLIRMLLAAGADPNAEAIDFIPPATHAEDYAVGYPSKYPNLRSFSMLQMAAHRCQADTVAALLAYHARRDAGAEGELPVELVRQAIAQSGASAACLRTLSLLD